MSIIWHTKNHLGLTLDGESHFAMRAEEMHAYGGNAKAKR